MWKRSIGACLLAALLVGAGVGCKKSVPPPVLPPPPVETVARLHWLGTEQLLTQSNATFLADIAAMPASRQLALQVLDRLAVGLLTTNAQGNTTNFLTATNAGASLTSYQSRLTGPPALLRPLLEDLARQECYLEVRQATNLPGDLALAIRLGEQRSGLWQTNLALILQALVGNRFALGLDGRSWQMPLARQAAAAPQQPSVASPLDKRFIEFGCVKDWALLGFGQETNLLVAEMAAMIQQGDQPFAAQPRKSWVYCDVDLRRVASALSLDWDLPPGLPKIALTVIGDRGNTRTAVALSFPQPLPFNAEPWNIPTNLIHEPIVSFTAMQGLTAWLSSLPGWQALQIGPPPNQLYVWGQAGVPFMTFFAASLPNGSNQLRQISDALVNRANPWLTNNGLGTFQQATGFEGALWADVGLVSPYLKLQSGNGSDFAFGGLEADVHTNRPAPLALFQQVTSITNLVAYDWELTGPRIEHWLYFGQLLRFVLHKAQIPPESASFAWLDALETRLSNCGTAVARTGPAQLSIVRNSSIGLSSAELDLLADWLESPRFPRGLNTFLGEPTPLPPRRLPRSAAHTQTNAIPSAP